MTVEHDRAGVSATSAFLGVGTELTWIAYLAGAGLWWALPESALLAVARRRRAGRRHGAPAVRQRELLRRGDPTRTESRNGAYDRSSLASRPLPPMSDQRVQSTATSSAAQRFVDDGARLTGSR